MTREVNAAGLDIIKREELCRLHAYLDSRGIPTIGWGHTDFVEDPVTRAIISSKVRVGDVVTQAEADALLLADCAKAEAAVEELCPGANDNEFSALVAFTFNCGKGNLYVSSIRRHFLLGEKRAAAASFALFNKAINKTTGQLEVLPGLVRRRAEEAALFLQPVA